jgi:hypothetical protein
VLYDVITFDLEETAETRYDYILVTFLKNKDDLFCNVIFIYALES